MEIDQAGRWIPTKTAEVQWHISRYDAFRSYAASRVGVILSADAVLYAGAGVIVTQLPGAKSAQLPLKLLVVAAAALTLILVSLSAFAAMTAIRHPPWRTLLSDDKSPFGLFYSNRDTLGQFGSFDEFASAFRVTDPNALLEYALVEFWADLRMNNYREQRLARAMQMLVGAGGTFLVTTIGGILTLL